MRLFYRTMLYICWFLEDIADKITRGKADWFYPSYYFENKLTELEEEE